jgi:hypothetical protein
VISTYVNLFTAGLLSGIAVSCIWAWRSKRAARPHAERPSAETFPEF